ncbi:MAG: hypothetical protein E6K55_05775 [Gemmatimonadetes bacterium]|nr:MAG: hypothetical protein E6K55_05775 [Gemmatimonadota bacterium]
MKPLRICIALSLGLPLGAVRAQDSVPLAPGARIRVSTPTPDCEELSTAFCHRRSVTGTLTSIDSLNIVLRDDHGAVVNVPRVAGTRLDLSTSPGACGRNRGECVGLGFLGGAAAGALVGFASVEAQGGAKACQENLCELIYWFTIPIGAVVGAIVGGVVGGEHWKAVDESVCGRTAGTSNSDCRCGCDTGDVDRTDSSPSFPITPWPLALLHPPESSRASRAEDPPSPAPATANRPVRS